MSTLIGVLVVVLFLGVGALRAEENSVPPEVIAKNLAENILGEQTVKHVKVSSNGDQIGIRWESPTYKHANPPETTRYLLKAEAELAGGAIMSIMRPIMLRFTILLGTKTLALGEMGRGGKLSISYASDLGGSALADASVH